MPRRLVHRAAARCVREEDGVVAMIDLEEIDLYAAAPGTTNARKIRAGKKFAAKIFANARSTPSWKRSLSALRGRKTRVRLAARAD